MKELKDIHLEKKHKKTHPSPLQKERETIHFSHHPNMWNLPSLSPFGATGVFRAATGVAAAPQRGANPYLRRRASRSGALCSIHYRAMLHTLQSYAPYTLELCSSPYRAMLHKHKSCTPTISEHSLFPNRAPKWPAGPASYQPRAAPWVLSVKEGTRCKCKRRNSERRAKLV